MDLQITNINTPNAIIWVFDEDWHVEWIRGDGSIGAILNTYGSSNVPQWAYNISPAFGKEIEQLVQSFSHKNNVLSIDPKGRTCIWPLLDTVALDKISEIIPQLVQMGVDINHKSLKGSSVLYDNCADTFFADCGYKILPVIVGVGADLNFQDPYGQTPIMLACAKALSKLESIPCLIELGADLSIVNEDNVNALDYLLLGVKDSLSEWKERATPEDSTIDEYAIEKYVEMIDLLITHGAKIREKPDGNPNWTPTIIHAVKSDCLEVVEAVLSHCVNVNVTVMNGTDALMWCDANSDIRIAKTLIDKGITIDRSTTDGFTALWFANEENNIELAKYLLSKGANPNVSDLSYGQGHLLFRAAYLGHKEIVELLISHGADVSLHIEDALWRNRLLIPENVILTKEGEKLETAMIITDQDIIDILLQEGCDSGIAQRGAANSAPAFFPGMDYSQVLQANSQQKSNNYDNASVLFDWSIAIVVR